MKTRHSWDWERELLREKTGEELEVLEREKLFEGGCESLTWELNPHLLSLPSLLSHSEISFLSDLQL